MDHPAHKPIGSLKDSYGLAQQSGGRSDLEPDKAPADDDDGRGIVESGTDPARIVGVTKVKDSVEVHAGNGRNARARPDGQGQLVVRQGRSIGERQQPFAPVDGDNLGTEAKIDLIFFVEGGRAKRQEVVCRVLEEGFRERRSLVGNLGLGGDKAE
jgi:hypothetical protein